MPKSSAVSKSSQHSKRLSTVAEKADASAAAPQTTQRKKKRPQRARNSVSCERRGGVRVDRRTRRVAAHATDIRGVPQSQKTRMSSFSYWRVAGRRAAKNYGVAQDYLWIRSSWDF